MKIKDRCKTDKKLKLYRVPKSVYQKALAEIFRKETSREKYNKRCHVRKFQYFKTNCRPLCLGNLMEACKQAFEDRDWKQLYIFLTKAMSYKGYQFRQQYLEYLFMAMENDTEIDTTDLMEAFLAQCRECKSDLQRDNFLKNTYLMSTDANDEEEFHETNKESLEELEEADIDFKELGIDINKL